MRSIIRSIVTFPIVIYQKLISPFLAPACRYYPTCSHYARDAIFRHGIAKGTVLASARILRCSSLFYGGYDPVPRLRNWKHVSAKIYKDYHRFRNKNTQIS